MGLIFQTRHARPEDQVYILDLDLKCFESAWSHDSWAYAGQHYVIKLATFYGTPIGFATYVYNTEKNVIQFPKVGVKRAFRNKGVGSRLVFEALQFCKQVRAQHVETLVPESLLRPGESQDASVWLSKLGWKATGIERDFFPCMGQREDAVRFTLTP